MRTTVDLNDEAYQVAKSIARERNESLGRVMSELILKGALGSDSRPYGIVLEHGVPVVSIGRVITSEDVRAIFEESA